MLSLDMEEQPGEVRVTIPSSLQQDTPASPDDVDVEVRTTNGVSTISNGCVASSPSNTLRPTPCTNGHRQALMKKIDNRCIDKGSFLQQTQRKPVDIRFDNLTYTVNEGRKKGEILKKQILKTFPFIFERFLLSFYYSLFSAFPHALRCAKLFHRSTVAQSSRPYKVELCLNPWTADHPLT